MKGNRTAYVSSDRDREVIVVDISSATAGRLVKRIKLDGNALGMTLDASGSRLFVAQDNADQVAVIDTTFNAVVAKIDARAPEGVLPRSDDDDSDEGTRYTGAATFAVTLSPDGRTLYAVNAGANSIAVIPLRGPRAYHVSGLIPTAYEPHDITLSADGGLHVHRQRQERHRAQPGTSRQQHGRDDEHHLSGRQRGRGRGIESRQPVPVPARARVSRQRSGADAVGPRAPDPAGGASTTSTSAAPKTTAGS